ncbi:MAG TPA: toprim domain-containing protein [Parachlamydiaceae bacterium]|nr:toprim domain-containing protein [Parachlamydiaceae bacterium]
MPYKSYPEQIQEHIIFLKSKGFGIAELKVNADFVRCHQVEKNAYRGEFTYKTRTTKLNNGLTGVQTWFRGFHGESSNFQTYGLGPSENEEIVVPEITAEAKQSIDSDKHDEAGRRAFGFWEYSATSGRSEYLERKRVGCYGVRFRNSAEYGDVAVVPMIDSQGRLWNYQLLNPDGTKRQPKGARTEGLFHVIGNPINGLPVGVAESYVTSASCFELIGIPTVCAFSCQNLKSIAILFKQRYPKSKLVIFADNDRHLEMRGATNQGLTKGREAIFSFEGEAVLVAPDFGDSEVCKGCSDWNDLINQKGFEYAKAQITEQLRKNASTQRETEK